MNSTLLQIAARFLSWPLVIVSLWLLYRGHNLPGGGFIGGLLAASAFVLYDLTGGGRPARGLFSAAPSVFLASGLGTAVLSALPGLFAGNFMKGLWLPAVEVPVAGKILLGTPFLFDVGVYLTVIGFILLLADTLADDSSP